MKDDENIDEEIKRFLRYEITPTKIDNTTKTTQPTTNPDNIKEILELLKEISATCEDAQNNNSKSNIINEKLLNLIRNIIQERQTKDNEIKDKLKTISQLESKIDKLEKRATKEGNNVKYQESSVKELNRIVQDQLSQIKLYKERFENEKRNGKTVKMINEEVNATKDNLIAKNSALAKQLKLFDEYLSEKDKTIDELRKVNNEKEGMLENYKKERNALNDKIENLISQNQIKSDNLAVLNSELAGLIAEVKRKENENREFKEKAGYYERLYKSVDSQNEYLNKQLAKMINIKNIDAIKVEDTVETKNEENELTQKLENLKITEKRKKSHLKRKIKGIAEQLQAKEIENRELKANLKAGNEKIFELANEIKRIRSDNKKYDVDYKNMNENLFNKIEELMHENRNKQDKIFELKKENIAHKINENPKKIKTQPINAKEDYFYAYNLDDKDDTFKTALETGNKLDTSHFLSFDDNDYKEEFKQVKDFITTEKANALLRPSYGDFPNVEDKKDYDAKETKFEKRIENKQVKDYNENQAKVVEQNNTRRIPEFNHNFDNRPVIFDRFNTERNVRQGYEYNENEKNQNLRQTYDFNQGNKNKSFEFDRKNDIADEALTKRYNFFDDGKNVAEHNIPPKKDINERNNGFFSDYFINDNKMKGDQIAIEKPKDYNSDYLNINSHKYDAFNQAHTNNKANEKEDSDSSFSSLKNIEFKGEEKEENLSTTSSLKKMIQRTDKLKEKFDDLEIQLDKIKSSKKDKPNKIQDQIREQKNFKYSIAYDKDDPDIL